MRQLRARGLEMVLIHCAAILRPWPCHNTAPAIKAGPAGCWPKVYAVNIYVAYNATIYPEYRGVISETTAAPDTTIKAIARIPETIIDTAIKTYMRPPVTTMEKVNPIIKPPVRRRP